MHHELPEILAMLEDRQREFLQRILASNAIDNLE